MKLIKAVFRRIISLIYCIYIKLWHINSFKFRMEEMISLKTNFIFSDEGKISIGNRCGIRGNCEFSVAEKGKIIIGDRCFFNIGCIVNSHNSILIGENTRFGPNVMIYDHDYDFKNIKNFLKGKHKSSPISIGKNVWIGAGCIILRGTIIEDNCVIGAGTVIKGTIKKNSIVLQKRENEINIIKYDN